MMAARFLRGFALAATVGVLAACSSSPKVAQPLPLPPVANLMATGLAWSVQAFDALPADPWDMPLDAILTEAEWILPPLSRIGH